MTSQRARELAWPHRPACYKDRHKDDWMAGVYDNAALVIKIVQSVIDGRRKP